MKCALLCGIVLASVAGSSAQPAPVTLTGCVVADKKTESIMLANSMVVSGAQVATDDVDGLPSRSSPGTLGERRLELQVTTVQPITGRCAKR